MSGQPNISLATREQIRLVGLLYGAQRAGIAPLELAKLHTYAFLANTLAPVWDMPVLDGKVYKREGSPFYPGLQADLDRLVGIGVINVQGLGHAQTEDGRWRLVGSYYLRAQFADPIIEKLSEIPEELSVLSFLTELAYAMTAMSDTELSQAMTEDAIYSDQHVDYGNVIDFAEWQHRNFSANAANYFAELVESQVSLTPGERLHLYMRHIQSRLRSKRHA